MTNNLRIASINIGTIRLRDKRQLLFNFFNRNKLDIIAVQELAFVSCDILEREFNLIANIGPKARGTGFLIRKGLGFSNVTYEPDGRIVKVKVAGISMIYIYNIYAPSGRKKDAERRTFFHEILPTYTIYNREAIFIMGDFNSIEEVGDRRMKSRTIRSKIECKALKDYVRSRGVKDIWKSLRGSEDGFTYIYRNGAARLDRFYSYPELITQIASVSILPTAFTDHHCIALEFNCGMTRMANRREHCLWKMNISILKDECFQTNFYEFWTRINAHPLRSSDVTRWWEKVFKPGLKILT